MYFFVRSGMGHMGNNMKNIGHFFFCMTWLFFAGVYAMLAIEAGGSINTTLTRCTQRVPPGAMMVIGVVNISNVINHVVDTTNSDIDKLETEMRRSARTSLWLNWCSCFMAILGFTAQVMSNRQERGQDHNESREHETEIRPEAIGNNTLCKTQSEDKSSQNP